MTGTRIIQVPVPADANATGEEVDLLESAFQAIVDLRFPHGREWERVRRALADEGWAVSARLMWVAEARAGARGGDGGRPHAGRGVRAPPGPDEDGYVLPRPVTGGLAVHIRTARERADAITRRSPRTPRSCP